MHDFHSRYLMIRHTHKKSTVAPTHTHQNPPPHTHRAQHLHKVATYDVFHPDNHILLGKDTHTLHTVLVTDSGKLTMPHFLEPINVFFVVSFSDVGPILSFSLSEGLHWVNPSHRYHFEFVTVDQISSQHHPKLPKHPSHRSQNSKRHNI